MDAEILLKMKQEFEDAYVTHPMCIYASYLKSEDLCIWDNSVYLGISDVTDYAKELQKFEENNDLLIGETEPILIYKTVDPKEIKKIKKIIGMVDYSKRLTELYSVVSHGNRLSLTKK